MWVNYRFGDMMINPVNQTQTTYLNFNLIAPDFEKDTILRNRELRTSKQYRKIVTDYVLLTGQEQFSRSAEYLDFKPHLMTFLESRQSAGYSYKTLKFHFTALNSFFEFLIDEGIINNNPVPSFRARYLTRYKIPEPPKSKQCTPEEVLKLINTAPNALFRAVIALYASTGRRQELIDLNIEDVDFERRILIAPDKKKRSNRTIIFSDWALDYLLDYLELRID